MRHANLFLALIVLEAPLLFCSPEAPADVLVTTSGTRFEGQVTDEGTAYLLVSSKGERMRFPKGIVAAVQSDTASAARADPAPGSSPVTPPSGNKGATDIGKKQPGGLAGSQNIAVVASGVGTTAESALKNALANAVEQAVGLVVDAETVVKNDRVIREQVITYSNAFVYSYDEISRERTADGLLEVRIKAVVEKKKLEAKLAAVNVTSSEIQGRNLFAQAVTQLKEETDAAVIVNKVFEHFPGNVLLAQPVGQVRLIDKTESEAVIGVTVRVAVDMAKYQQWYDMALPLLTRASKNSLPLRWGPDHLGMRTLASFFDERGVGSGSTYAAELNVPWERRLHNKFWGKASLPADDWARAYIVRRESCFERGWLPESAAHDKGLVLIGGPRASSAVLLLFEERPFRELERPSVALPIVSVALKDSSGHIVALQEWAAVAGTSRRLMLCPFLFWALSTNQNEGLVSVAFDAYYDVLPDQGKDCLVNPEAMPKFRFPNMRIDTPAHKLVIAPYCAGQIGGVEFLVAGFYAEYVFRVPLSKLHEIVKTEVAITSRDNLPSAAPQTGKKGKGLR